MTLYAIAMPAVRQRLGSGVCRRSRGDNDAVGSPSARADGPEEGRAASIITHQTHHRLGLGKGVRSM